MSKRVFLGVGHGGNDGGASANGWKEKDINLNQALACKCELERHGVIVGMSRIKDENDSIEEEVRECNSFNPDLAAEFHNNAGGGDGFECYYHPSCVQSKNASLSIEDEVKKFGQNSRGCKANSSFQWTANVKAPSVLIEGCFLDNIVDFKIMDTVAEQQAFGRVVAKGILEHLGITYKPNGNPPASNSESNGEMYRVRKSWADASSQKGAFSVLDNAILECKKHSGYKVYSSVGTQVYPESIISAGKRFVHLKAHMTSWAVYPLNEAPIKANACGYLNPNLFGGLDYEILGNPQTDVYTIQTSSFGRVNIYIPADGDSSFYIKEESTPQQTPQPSNKKYLNLHPHNSSWRVYPLGSSVTIGNECGSLAPSQYGGLSYEIIEDKGDIKIINTSSFGKVQIFAPRDEDSSITGNPIY